jgi:hypothetical protein
MNNKMRKKLALLFLVVSVHLFSQEYPVTGITINLPATPDANTANWASSAPVLSVTVNSTPDFIRRLKECRIALSIKQGDAIVCGVKGGSTTSIFSFGSAPVKVWVGSNALALLGQDCVLKPGEYQLCAQVFAAEQGAIRAISREVCKPFTIKAVEEVLQNYQAPQAISPANKSTLSDIEAKKPVTFRWVPVVPKPKDNVTYRLKVWQLMQGQNGTQAMKTNAPLISKEVQNQNQAIVTNLYTGPCKPPYLCDFVWNVQALDSKGNFLGRNSGLSEASEFGIETKGDAPLLKMMGGANAEFKIDSVICLQKENGLFKYHVWAHYSNLTGSVDNILLNDNQSFAGYPANPNPGTGLNLRNNIRMKSGSYNGTLTMNDILESSSGTISNITPLPASGSTPAFLAPNSIHNFQFDFATPTNTPVQFTYYGLVNDALKDKPNRNSRNEIDSLKYPPCPCSICDEIQLAATQNGEIKYDPNGVLSFAANVSSSPKKVLRIRAELVYFDMKADDENCLICNKKSNTFGNFTSVTTSNTNFTGSLPYGHSAQFDALTAVNISGGVPINFSISIPPIVSCCNATVNFCIRYVITFEDCTVCNTLACYQYKITGCPK